MKDTLERISWPNTKCDRLPIGKYQLFLHNLNAKASAWLLFVKKKIMPTRHDNTISMEKGILLYYIMEEISVNVRGQSDASLLHNG